MSMRGSVVIVAAGAVAAVAGVATAQTVPAGETSISGVVRSADGPEAGVWVIAETDNLETGFRKIVVTGDDGRFLIPDLATATYEVWVRGYGLADSERRTARPGDALDLSVSAAATPQDAASVYPANYWYSLIEVPPPADFPGTGDNGINPAMRTQEHFIDGLKDGCQLCHQLGNEATREMPMVDLDEFDSTADAWAFRLGTGATGSSMIRQVNEMGRQRTLDVYADWTDRILAGEVPAAPPRPSGVERNLVLTMWKWSSAQKHVHDNIATDKRNPRLNANGPVYGILGDNFVAVDPAAHRGAGVGAADARRDEAGGRRRRGRAGPAPGAALPLLGRGAGLRGRERAQPDDGRRGPGLAHLRHPSCREPGVVPGRLASVIGLPSGGAEHAAGVLLRPGGGRVRLHRQLLHHAPPAVRGGRRRHALVQRRRRRRGVAQHPPLRPHRGRAGGPGLVPDRHRHQRRRRHHEAVERARRGAGPARDTRLDGFAYGIIPNPADGSIWITRGSMSGPATEFPGSILRLDPGTSPPETCIAEVYEPPFENPAVGQQGWGFGPRGIDVDRNGVLWTALSGSGHLASFDRSKCAVLNGPTATGQHCPEGWTLHSTPGPRMRGVAGSANADFHYYKAVDPPVLIPGEYPYSLVATVVRPALPAALTA